MDYYSAEDLAGMGKEFDDDRDQATIDEEAVDAFAKSMKRKLAADRAKGRGGWRDHLRCKNTDLSDALRAHVEKGDPVDVANVAMMIHQRYERIATAHPSGLLVMPLEWAADHGDDHRLFLADTPLGRFAYGTDNEAKVWRHGPDTTNEHASEDDARRAAEVEHAALTRKRAAALGIRSAFVEGVKAELPF